MDVDSKNINKNSNSKKEKDGIIDKKPESIKMDILYFKEEILHEVKNLERNLMQKNKETNDTLKENISNLESKYNSLKDNMNSLSDKVIEGIKIEEKLNEIYKTKETIEKETNANKIKISLLEKETHDGIYGINELLKQTILYPGVIGTRGKFNNFHEFIDFLLSESNANSNFRNQKIMDLSTFKLKIDKNLSTMGFKIQSNLISSNSYTDSKMQEILDKIDDFYRKNKKNLDDLRIENSDYVIQLERDTKDLRNEINNIKKMKTEIYARIEDALNSVRIEKEKMMEKLSEYKVDVDKAQKDINRLEKKIKELIVEKIGLLFDEQKQANKDIDKMRKIFDEYKINIEEKIDNNDNKITKDQTQLFKSIDDINNKLNIIVNHIANNDKIYKSQFQNLNNIQKRNLENNNNLLSPLKKKENENSRNKDNNNLIKSNQISNLDNINISMNNNIFESLNINRKKLKKIRSSQNIENNINRKSDKNIAFSQNVNLYSFNGLNDKKVNIKKLALSHKNFFKKKSNTNFEDEKDFDFNNYIKYYSNINRKKIRKSSFDHEKIETLQKFQKLLKININDINGHLSNFNNISSTSFKVLNEKNEIFDRFFLSNEGIALSDNKYLNIKNDNTIDKYDNKLNTYSKRNLSAKNLKDEGLSTKNVISKKTECNFFPIDANKKKEEQILIKFKKNNKIIYLSKKQNHNSSSLRGNIKNKKFVANTLTRYHNYFIGFYDDENKNDKSKDKKTNKNIYKRNNISLNNYQIIDDRKNNMDINFKNIKRFIGTKDK